MRQGPQNRRGRGRNNRKGGQHSPLTRSFESSGPDVKIRGTPAHIGEKYMSLARDAAASGDPVLAENYLQHAEHYNRIIMAAREQNGADTVNGIGRNGLAGEHDPADAMDEMADDENSDFGGESQPMRQGEIPHRGFDSHQRTDERSLRRPHEPNSYRAPRDRNLEEPRQRGFNSERHRHGGNEQPAEPRPVDRPISARQETPRRRDRPQPEHHEQPEFLRRPVRRTRREGNGNGVPVEGEPAGGPSHDDDPE